MQKEYAEPDPIPVPSWEDLEEAAREYRPLSSYDRSWNARPPKRDPELAPGDPIPASKKPTLTSSGRVCHNHDCWNRNFKGVYNWYDFAYLCPGCAKKADLYWEKRSAAIRGC